MTTSTHSAEPAQSMSAPLSTLDLGGIALTYLPDGIHHVEAQKHYPDAPQGTWEDHPEVLNNEGLLVMSVGAFLVRTPSENILIDLGFGPEALDMTVLTEGKIKGDMIGGELLDSLAAAGLTPEQIDRILISHMHMDHIGWLVAPGSGGSPTFPNASYVIDGAELDFWKDLVNPPGPVAGVRGGPSPEEFAVVESNLVRFSGQTEVAPGITMIPTPGHTCGHASVLVTGERARALVIGDALHCPVELQCHGLTYSHDRDTELAAQSRELIYSILAEDNTYFAGGHFPRTVFGRMAADRTTIIDVSADLV